MNPKKQLWWEKYRKREEPRLNLELIMRKSVRDTAREYLHRCSIAGIHKIQERDVTIKERLTYLAVFLTSFFALLYLLRWTEAQTFSNPLVVTEESSTYPIKLIDFPAVAVCNINRISKKALDILAKEIHINLSRREDLNVITLEELTEYLVQYGKLIDFSFTEDMKVFPQEFEFFGTQNESHRIVNLMARLAPSCDEMLVRCAWAGKVVDCNELFSVRRTIRGHCCVFNYILALHAAHRSNRTLLMPAKRQIERGIIHGLHVILDPQIEDYAYPITVTRGFDLKIYKPAPCFTMPYSPLLTWKSYKTFVKIMMGPNSHYFSQMLLGANPYVFLFDPKNYADPSGGRVVHRLVSLNEASFLEIQSIKQLAAPEVRHYPVATRKCHFQNELKSFGNLYSYSACIVDCRINTVKTLCKCTPYFMPISINSGHVCTLERLRCLNKYKEKMLYQYPIEAETWKGLEMEVEDSLFCPDCRPDCEYTKHMIKSYNLPMHLAIEKSLKSKEHRLSFTVDINITNKCRLSVFQSTGDGALNRLDVISYWFEILSNVGGFAGILLGLSIISAIEIVYFVIIWFPHIFYVNYKKYY